MPEQNSNDRVLTRRSAEAQMPGAMTRGRAPALPAQNPYLEMMTREEEITDGMKKPLSAREKPLPAEAVFPPPEPAVPVLPRSAGAILRPSSTPAPAPMPRHTITTEELARSAWNYTRVEDLPAPPPKDKKRKPAPKSGAEPSK